MSFMNIDRAHSWIKEYANGNNISGIRNTGIRNSVFAVKTASCKANRALEIVDTRCQEMQLFARPPVIKGGTLPRLGSRKRLPRLRSRRQLRVVFFFQP